MTEPDPTLALPRRLLLATDLSARCDRAMDRAAWLACHWQAEMVALTIVDPSGLSDHALALADGADDASVLGMARRQLERDLEGVPVRAAVRVLRAPEPAAAIRDAVAREAADLVVTGVARNELLGRFLLGSTVERLARALREPLLVVRNRAGGPYRRVVVATDFSEPSRAALRLAAWLFPEAELVLYHSRDVPMAGLAGHVPDRGAAAAIERDECAKFLRETGLPSAVSVRPLVEFGPASVNLCRHARHHDVDLVVMGSRGAGAVRDMLLGSTASRLLDWLPCDALLVRA